MNGWRASWPPLRREVKANEREKKRIAPRLKI
jgi:hypothetical protein